MPEIKHFATSTITSLNDWKSISKNHENESRSAYLVGQRWLGASGDFPPAIKTLLKGSMANIRPVFSIAEHISVLDTLTAPSRTDLMIYCRDGRYGKAVIAIEGKVDEKFDKRISDWIRNGQDPITVQISEGKKRRLQWLCKHLDLPFDDQSRIRYQLLHRTVAALQEAKHVGAAVAIMLVQSFGECAENWADFAAFGEAMGFTSIAPNSISEPKLVSAFPGIRLHLGWADDLPAKLD